MKPLEDRPIPADPISDAEVPAPTGPAGFEEPARLDEAIGVIVAREGVDVSAQLDGRLRSVAVRVGDRVERGDELARIEAHDLDEQLAEARASLRAAQADSERAAAEAKDAEEQAERREQGGDLFSAEERQTAASAAEAARAALKSAQARVDEQQAAVERLSARRGRSTLSAPASGEVAARYLDPGAVVATGQPVVRLISADSFLARFAVSPREAASWSVGDSVAVAVESLDTSLPGRVSQIAPRVDSASQMIFLEAELDLPGDAGQRLQDGLVATVRRVEPSEQGPDGEEASN